MHKMTFFLLFTISLFKGGKTKRFMKKQKNIENTTWYIFSPQKDPEAPRFLFEMPMETLGVELTYWNGGKPNL